MIPLQEQYRMAYLGRDFFSAAELTLTQLKTEKESSVSHVQSSSLQGCVLSPHAHTTHEAFYGIIITVYLILYLPYRVLSSPHSHRTHRPNDSESDAVSRHRENLPLCITVSVLGVCDSRDNYCGDLVLISDRCPSTAYR